MKKRFVLLLVCALYFLTACGGSAAGAAGSYSMEPVFHQTRSGDDAVLIADVDRVWDGLFEAETENRYECAVLECIVRRVIEPQESGVNPTEKQLTQGDSFFLWVGLESFEFLFGGEWTIGEGAQIEEALDLLASLESVAVWGKPETRNFREEHPSYEAIREEYGTVEADATVTVTPLILVNNPLRRWCMIPLNEGVVDAEPIEKISKAIYGRYQPYFYLDSPRPETGLYFANGDTEEEFIAAVERFEKERDAGKKWLTQEELAHRGMQKQAHPNAFWGLLFISWLLASLVGVVFVLWKLFGPGPMR